MGKALSQFVQGQLCVGNTSDLLEEENCATNILGVQSLALHYFTDDFGCEKNVTLLHTLRIRWQLLMLSYC